MDIPTLYELYRRHPTIVTDTRQIKPGCIFFALKGDKFDGNTFAHKALESGAAHAVISDTSLQDERFVHVPDTLEALQQLSKFHRNHFWIPFIGITGTNGKTTTKELITGVLSKKYRVHATTGNYNNHIGVPLTLLNIADDTEIAVIEMGANHEGEIQFLCDLAMPTHGLITNIGKAHLEGFGSIDGVQMAKGELYDYLAKTNGFVFVNADDPRLAVMAENLPLKTKYGTSPDRNAEFAFELNTNKNEPGFILSKGDVRIPSSLFGDYNAINMVAAFVVGSHFAVDVPDMIDFLSSFKSGANRSETSTIHGCTIIKDAYNANPSSMEKALNAFKEKFPNGWLLLGDMKELGSESRSLHQQMIRTILDLRFDHIILVGREFMQALKEMEVTDQSIITAETIEEIQKDWRWEKCHGKALLLKGSRSMHLEKILESG
ncbi:MAG: UDP-N-acetylmuramoyl-tripeptide--D-alanyl-D-alanine ligase [Saprospiraceae bacterium]